MRAGTAEMFMRLKQHVTLAFQAVHVPQVGIAHDLRKYVGPALEDDIHLDRGQFHDILESLLQTACIPDGIEGAGLDRECGIRLSDRASQCDALGPAAVARASSEMTHVARIVAGLCGLQAVREVVRAQPCKTLGQRGTGRKQAQGEGLLQMRSVDQRGRVGMDEQQCAPQESAEQEAGIADREIDE